MKKPHYIITGTSRGIGEALASQLLDPNHVIICISRNTNPMLAMEANKKDCKFKDIAFDLSEVERIPELMHRVIRRILPEEVEFISLINNAGVIHPIKPIGQRRLHERVIRNVNVNLTAPMLLTEYLIRATEDWDVERKVVNLGTGASSRPIHGWSAYCSTKSGLEMFGECLALEQEGVDNPVKIVSFAPGVVDTEMQMEIRETEKNNFKDVDRFRNLKKEGELNSPAFVATEIIKLLKSPDFGSKISLRIGEQ